MIIMIKIKKIYNNNNKKNKNKKKIKIFKFKKKQIYMKIFQNKKKIFFYFMKIGIQQEIYQKLI